MQRVSKSLTLRFDDKLLKEIVDGKQNLDIQFDWSDTRSNVIEKLERAGWDRIGTPTVILSAKEGAPIRNDGPLVEIVFKKNL